MSLSKVDGRPIRVLLVCDLPVVAWGLEKLIDSASPAMKCTGTAETPAETLRQLRTEPADVILLDLDGENGIGMIPELLAASRARILVLTGTRDLEQVDGAVLAGASGSISKREQAAVLLKAIEKVHGGEFWVDRSATVRILVALARQKAATDPEQDRIARLTRKERMTAAEIARDASITSRDIAERLNISEHTLRNHLTSIYSKLGLANRLELFAYANRHGLNRLMRDAT